MNRNFPISLQVFLPSLVLLSLLLQWAPDWVVAPVLSTRLLLYGAGGLVLLEGLDLLIRRKPAFKATEIWLELSVAIFGSWFYVLIAPDFMVDDAGFILRYLDHFQEACWFCYNPEEGGVFGISGFLYGLIAGLINYFQLARPEETLYTLNFVSLFFVLLLTLKIVRTQVENLAPAIFSLVLVLLAGTSFRMVAFSGMESGLQLALILGAVYAAIRGKSGSAWLWMSLAVVGKLDAVPVAILLGLFLLIKAWKAGRFLAELRKGSIWAGPPLLLYFILTAVFFGGPFPQSAYAKMFLHSHQSDHWFPFLTWFLDTPFRASLFVGTGFVMVLEGVVSRLRNQFKWSAFLPGLCGMTVLFLYYVYNPGEKMIWYYAVPEFLLGLQGVLSLTGLTKLFPSGTSRGILYLTGSLIFMLIFGRARLEFSQYVNRINVVDRERQQVGAYLAERSGEEDKLLMGHGHIGRPFPGLVLDYTGLNSKLLTEYELDLVPVVRDEQPDWAAFPDWESGLDLMGKNGYVLDRVWYDCASFGSVPIKAFYRGGHPVEYVRGNPDNIIIENGSFQEFGGGRRIVGEAFSLLRPSADSLQLRLGIFRKEAPFELQVQYMSGDSLAGKAVIFIPALEEEGFHDHGSGAELTFPIGLSLSPAEWERISEIRLLKGEGLEGKVEIIDPIWVLFPFEQK